MEPPHQMKIYAEQIRKEIVEAGKRIHGSIRETPLEYSAPLSEKTGSGVWLKLENYQRTGSFKIRGALNKILSIADKSRMLVTSSTGNHALAFASGISGTEREGIIYLPETASGAKLEALGGDNIEIRIFGDDCVKAEIEARRFSGENGCIYISPYNDIRIIGGAGTAGWEIWQQNSGREIDSVLVPVGGGGLISGIAGYFKSLASSPEIIGCQPSNSAVMYRSLLEGSILDITSSPTISDGTAGGIEEGSITFDICREYVDDFILVTEEEIEEAIEFILIKHSMLIEGAAALPVAALLKSSRRFQGKKLALLISGCRLNPACLKRIIC